MISPVFEKIAETITSVEYYKVDVDAHQDISQEVGIRAVSILPTKFVVVAMTLGLDAHIRRIQRRGGSKKVGWPPAQPVGGTSPPRRGRDRGSSPLLQGIR